MEQKSTQNFQLKLLVAKEENRVILAESNKEFIEVLFSFMILPIGSVIRSTPRSCYPGKIGSLNNLYSSVKNLDRNFFQSETYPSILLNPRSAAEIYCKNLQVNLTDPGDCNDLYACLGPNCNMVSYVKTGVCLCEEKLKQKILNQTNKKFFPGEKDIFVKSTARFVITDDLKVTPVSTMTGLTLLNELGVYGKIEERIICIGRQEVLELLKCSLRSRTPLTTTFLKPQTNKPSFDTKYGLGGMNPSLGFFNFRINIRVKLIFNKVKNTVLYAIVDENFVNVICTFLMLPLGYIFRQFPSLSFEGCAGNIYKSIKDTQVNLFCHREIKDILVNPKLPPGLGYNGGLFGIQEATVPIFCSNYSSHFNAKRRILFSRHFEPPRQDFKGFIKGPSTFMVTDNLEIKTLSPISVKSLVDSLGVPLRDIDEQEVILDDYKALRLLAAFMASEQALTVALLQKEPSTNCFDFLGLMWGGKSC